MAVELFPIVTTPDLARALAFYRDMLGGRVTFEFPGPDGEPDYVGVDVGTSHIGIGRDASAAGGQPGRISLWIYVEDCDATIEAMRAAGITVTEEPADQPWRERVARVLDPDGNEVIVGAKPRA